MVQRFDLMPTGPSLPEGELSLVGIQSRTESLPEAARPSLNLQSPSVRGPAASPGQLLIMSYRVGGGIVSFEFTVATVSGNTLCGCDIRLS